MGSKTGLQSKPRKQQPRSVSLHELQLLHSACYPQYLWMPCSAERSTANIGGDHTSQQLAKRSAELHWLPLQTLVRLPASKRVLYAVSRHGAACYEVQQVGVV
jgi:hypothetical protein